MKRYSLKIDPVTLVKEKLLADSIVALATEINVMFSSAIRPLLSEENLTTSEFELLSVIRQADGNLSLSKIARQLGLSRATVSEAVTSLESRGWVTKVASIHDRRTIEIRLMPSAHPRMNRLHGAVRELDRSWNEMLSDKERDLVVRTLNKLTRLVNEPEPVSTSG